MSLQKICRRRLQALGHFDPESFDINDQKQFRNCVRWLENQKLLVLNPNERSDLNQIDSGKWNMNFDNYLKKLGTNPDNYPTKEDKLVFLLGKAVQQDFINESGKIDSSINLEDVGVVENSPQFKENVEKLAQHFQLQSHPNPMITFMAVLEYIDKVTSQYNVDIKKVQQVNLDDHRMGVSNKKLGLEKALKILRLIQIQELRNIQDKVNNAIESIQKLTADPKTNVGQGKVGV